MSMPIMLLRMFQRQVLLQCDFLIRAAKDCERYSAANDTEGVFYAIQNLLNASANVSKALWGQNDKRAAERAAGRQALRASIGVTDDSPLRLVKMRNNFEHFDERLDEWWRDSPAHNYLDLSVIPRSKVAGIDHKDWFRVLDPTTLEITFWSQDFNLQALISEVERIRPTLAREAAKPHFDPSEIAPQASASDSPQSAATEELPPRNAPSDS